MIADQTNTTAAYQRHVRTLDQVSRERARQRELLATGAILDDCADAAVNDFIKLAVLAEEFGEAARAVNQLDGLMRRPGADAWRIKVRRGNLRHELIQTAAVAVAWAESLEEGAAGGTPAEATKGNHHE